MSLSDLASLGSLVSGVAVPVSLVFLYFQVRQVNQQVRQAEKNQRATIAQVRASRTAEMAMQQTDPAVATAFRKAMAGAEDLPPPSFSNSSGAWSGPPSPITRTCSCSASTAWWRMPPIAPGSAK
jgi:hypothetical protein